MQQVTIWILHTVAKNACTLRRLRMSPTNIKLSVSHSSEVTERSPTNKIELHVPLFDHLDNFLLSNVDELEV